MTTRIETDLLGKKEINNEFYYGVHTQRAIENFNISSEKISDVPEFVLGMIYVKKAAAMANKDLKAIPQDKANFIIKACEEILAREDDKYISQFPVDVFQGGAGTSVNMNTNEVVANVALELMGEPKGSYNIINPNDHVNKCQSTNGAYPTGFRIAVYSDLQKLLAPIELLQKGFLEKGKEFKDIIKMGRTQLQDAVPMSVGQEFEAYATLLKEELKNISLISDLLLEVNLGATAIGTGLNAVEGFHELSLQKLSQITGFECKSPENLIEATSDCGAYVMVHSALKRLAVKLSKICNDLRLLSSGPRVGLNELNLPEMQAGSSIMPAKVNPVIPEVVNQVCFKVIGNDMTITMAAEAGQLQLNVMEPVIGQCMFESIKILGNACVNLQEKCISGITVNEKVCLDGVFNSIGIITYLNPFIGHDEGDIVGKICAQTGKNVREVVLERGLMEESKLDKILSKENLMNPKYTAKQED